MWTVKLKQKFEANFWNAKLYCSIYLRNYFSKSKILNQPIPTERFNRCFFNVIWQSWRKFLTGVQNLR